MSEISTYALSSPKNVECFNNDSSFKIINYGNPRNQATDQIFEHQGAFPFEGVWLWLESDEGESLNKSQTKYKTMNDGTLTGFENEQALIESSGCGRGSCNNNQKFISAQYLSLSANEFIAYNCNETVLY